jgi:phospholipase C
VKLSIIAAMALAFAGISAGCGGGGGGVSIPSPEGSASPSPPPGTIDHIVIIVQENRTVDDLFNGLPGANTVTQGKTSTGGMAPLKPIPLEAPYDLGHSHSDFRVEYDGGAMDGFDLVAVLPEPGYSPTPDSAYGYVPHSESAPYFQMAERYAFADEMFQTNQGPSFPSHQYLIAGTSIPQTGSALLDSEDVTKYGNTGRDGGCDAPPGASVQLIDQSGNESQTTFPCFEHQTLPDLLDAHSVAWKYYTPKPYYIWSGVDAIQHLRYGPDWVNVVSPETQILTDINKGRLPSVSWVVPTADNSDHSGQQTNTGPSWVASIVNAVGQSPYWNTTAIFVTWDDWGGWYDHVRPQIFNSYELGLRVPLIVISPYARSGFVSHKQHEFGSILKFVEERFSLGSLGYTDARADDLGDCFDFSQPPLPFVTINAPYSRQNLLARWRYGPPDDDE